MLERGTQMEYKIDGSVRKIRDMVAQKAQYYDIERNQIIIDSQWQAVLYLVDRGIAAMIEEKKKEDGVV